MLKRLSLLGAVDQRDLSTRAGTPAAIVRGGMDFVTTAPEATIASLPTSTPGSTSTRIPNQARAPIFTGAENMP